MCKKEAEWVFGLADKDKDGSLDADEIASLVNNNVVLKRFIDAINGEGKIDITKWTAYIHMQYAKEPWMTARLLKNYAKQCGVDEDFEAFQKRQDEERLSMEAAHRESDLERQSSLYWKSGVRV